MLIFGLFVQLLCLPKKISESSYLAFELLLPIAPIVQISGCRGPISHEVPIPAQS